MELRASESVSIESSTGFTELHREALKDSWQCVARSAHCDEICVESSAALNAIQDSTYAKSFRKSSKAEGHTGVSLKPVPTPSAPPGRNVTQTGANTLWPVPACRLFFGGVYLLVVSYAYGIGVPAGPS